MRDYLSGLLIGSEVGAMQGLFPHQSTITLIGADALAGRYARALRSFGIAAESLTSEVVTVQGLVALSRIVNWPGE